MRKTFVQFALVCLGGLAIGGPEPATAVWCPSGAATELVALSNAYRLERGRPALEPDARLFVAADRLARDLAGRGELSHLASDGSRPADRAAAAGYARTFVAENIAAGQTGPAQVIRSWAGSRGHRANLLDDRVRHVGAARVVGRPACRRCPPHYWVLVVGDTRGASEPLDRGCGLEAIPRAR